MLKVLIFFFLVSAIQGSKEYCQKKYDFTLFILPNVQSVYLEARNEILFADYLTVECDTIPANSFTVNHHLSFLNSHAVFRAFIGNTTNTSINCKIKVDNLFCDATNDNYAFSWKNYIPAENTEWDPKLSLLNPYDTKNGFYTWIENDLLIDLDCERVIKEIKDIARLSPKIRKFNEESLLADQRIYLSITTSPTRLLKLHYVLKSLDLFLVDTVFIILPLEFKRKERYSIPLKLVNEFSKVQFLSLTQDLGPIIKSISAVEFVRSIRGLLSNNDIFIQIDDDNCYSINTIDTLVYFTLLNPNSAISGNTASLSFYGLSNFGYSFSRNRNIIGGNTRTGQIIEGYLGIASRGINIDVELIKALTRRDLNPELSSCYLSDDLVLSFVLSFKNLQLLGILWDIRGEDMYSNVYRREFHYFVDENALHLRNPDESRSNEWNMNTRYRMCYQQILKHFLDFSKQNIPYKSRNEVLESLYSSFRIR